MIGTLWHLYLAEAALQLRRNYRNRFYLFALFVQPVVWATILYYLFVQTRRPDLLPYVLVGPGLLVFVMSAVYIVGSDLIRERESRTLAYLIASPTPLMVILIGKLTADLLSSLLSFLATAAYTALLTGAAVPLERLPLFLLALAVLAVSLAGIGLITAAILLMVQSGRWVQNLLSMPLTIYSGIYFPVSLLPGVLAWPSRLLSVWWCGQALRDALAPAVPGDFGWKLLMSLLLGVAYMAAAAYFLRVVERRVMRTGELEIGG